MFKSVILHSKLLAIFAGGFFCALVSHSRGLLIIADDSDQNPYRSPSVTVDPVTDSSGLPPFIVKLFSFLFVPFVLCPIPLLGDSAETSVVVFAFQFSTPRDPMLPIAWLSAVLAFGGIVGLLILLRLRSAYDLAIVYCVFAVVSIVSIHICYLNKYTNWLNGLWQYLMLLWFFQHVVRKRVAWRSQMERSN